MHTPCLNCTYGGSYHLSFLLPLDERSWCLDSEEGIGRSSSSSSSSSSSAIFYVGRSMY